MWAASVVAVVALAAAAVLLPPALGFDDPAAAYDGLALTPAHLAPLLERPVALLTTAPVPAGTPLRPAGRVPLDWLVEGEGARRKAWARLQEDVLHTEGLACVCPPQQGIYAQQISAHLPNNGGVAHWWNPAVEGAGAVVIAHETMRMYPGEPPVAKQRRACVRVAAPTRWPPTLATTTELCDTRTAACVLHCADLFAGTTIYVGRRAPL